MPYYLFFDEINMKIKNFSQLVEWFDSEMGPFKKLLNVDETDEYTIFKWIFNTEESLFLMEFLGEMEWEENWFSKNIWNWKWEVVYNIPFI